MKILLKVLGEFLKLDEYPETFCQRKMIFGANWTALTYEVDKEI